jgi:uncharacterized glyoxalase superfamily protein PhnB
MKSTRSSSKGGWRARAAEAGMHVVSPHLVCKGAARAIDFYKEAFGAKEMMRLAGPDGKIMHACVSINGSSVMLVDEMPDWKVFGPKHLGGTPVTIHLMVDDADAVVDRAVKAGATVKMPVADQFWGDRYGVIEDPFGHSWSVATPGKPKSEAEIREAMKAISGTDCPAGEGTQVKRSET